MASCYPCTMNAKLLASGVGLAGDSIGCCRVCHVLACGHHAHRDAKVPQFICVECDPKLLAASAGANLPPDNPLAGELRFYNFQEDFRAFAAGYLFRSLEEFIERRPRYGEDFVSRVRQVHFTSEPWVARDEVGRTVLGLPRESQDLLIAAMLLVELYNLELPTKTFRELETLLPQGWNWR